MAPENYIIEFNAEPDPHMHKTFMYVGKHNNGILFLSYKITKSWSTGCTYQVRFDMEDIRDKAIVMSSAQSLEQAKYRIKNIIPLIYKANTPGNAYLFKGIMLGFYLEEQMQHLK